MKKFEERAKFGDEKYLKCWEFVVGSDKICIIYHAECYKSATNKKILNGLGNTLKIYCHLLLKRSKMIPLMVGYWMVTSQHLNFND